MKVAIVTLIGDNYGNRLQNYALQEILEENNLKVETLKNISNIDQSSKTKIKAFLKSILFIYKPIQRSRNSKRHNKFKEFDKKFIKYSKYIVSNEKIPKDLSKSYDYFICGSDQVWNPQYKQNGKVNFLGFINSEKKVSYAASIGSEFIPENRKKELTEYLNDFNVLSIREESNIEILQSIVDKPIEVHIDPTLLLKQKEWIKIEKKPSDMIKEEYLFTYFLGEITQEQEMLIKKIAKEKNLTVINLNDEKWYSSIGPSEFLYLISHCSFICTDSFHGVVFSIINKKDFISFPRNGIGVDMSSRLISLLRLVGLEDRYYDSKNSVLNLRNIDYSDIDKILFKEREKSKTYLNKVISK